MEDLLAPIGCNIPLNVVYCVYYMISTFILKEFRTMSMTCLNGKYNEKEKIMTRNEVEKSV